MCYHTKFGRFRSNHLGVVRSKNLGYAGAPPPWDGDVADPRRSIFLYHLCYHVIFGQLRLNRTNIIMEIRLEILAPCVRLSGSLKVIGTGTDRSATYDFLLTIHSNQLLFSTQK